MIVSSGAQDWGLRRSARRCWWHGPFPQPRTQRPERIAPEGQAQAAERGPGGEASLVLPDLDSVDVGGYNGRTLLVIGLVVSLRGRVFGAVTRTAGPVSAGGFYCCAPAKPV